MNRKGQVLIMFILLIPLVFMFIALIIDLGLYFIDSKKVNNTLKYVINTSLDNGVDNQKIVKTLDENIEKIDSYDIKYENDILTINVVKNYKGIFTNIFKTSLYKIDTTYYGYIDNGNIIINKK